MNIVTRHIEYLLLRKDCVTLPGVGAFLARTNSAELTGVDTPESASYTAPCREICFSSEITGTDGLLATSIARSLGISYEKASAMVAREAAAIRAQIVGNGEVAMGSLGTLGYDPEADAITFTRACEDRLSTFSPWLQSVNATPITYITRREAKANDMTAGSRTGRSPIMRWMKAAAAVAVLIGVGFTLMTPITVDNATLASLSVPEVTRIEQSALLPKAPGEHATSLSLACVSDTTILFVSSDAAEREQYRNARTAKPARAATVTPQADAPTLSIDDSQQYCVIIASLQTQADADKYIASQKGGNLGILAKDGKYRIYCATAPSSGDAQRIAASQAVKGRYPGAWVCSR